MARRTSLRFVGKARGLEVGEAGGDDAGMHPEASRVSSDVSLAIDSPRPHPSRVSSCKGKKKKSLTGSRSERGAAAAAKSPQRCRHRRRRVSCRRRP